MKENSIDFVITWVDGSDKKWLESFNRHIKLSGSESYVNEEMFRDYGVLKYWFRGVEKFAPWVRKIHFITCGHYPPWLDLENPKLNIVDHKDYIPNKYLPVFSARPIELNFHRIEDLSENFVFFNDDMFLLNNIKPDFFFRNNLPCDSMIMKYISGNKGIDHTILNNIGLINKNFNKRSFTTNNISKLFNIRYKLKDRIKNLLLLGGRSFSGFYNYHMPQPYKKSTYKEVWDRYEDSLIETTASKFRNLNNVNQYLFRFLALAKGEFYPVDMSRDREYFGLTDDNSKLISVIKNQKCKVVCINDERVNNFQSVKEELYSAFDQVLNKKSSFER